MKLSMGGELLTRSSSYKKGQRTRGIQSRVNSPEDGTVVSVAQAEGDSPRDSVVSDGGSYGTASDRL